MWNTPYKIKRKDGSEVKPWGHFFLIVGIECFAHRLPPSLCAWILYFISSWHLPFGYRRNAAQQLQSDMVRRVIFLLWCRGHHPADTCY